MVGDWPDGPVQIRAVVQPLIAWMWAGGALMAVGMAAGMLMPALAGLLVEYDLPEAASYSPRIATGQEARLATPLPVLLGIYFQTTVDHAAILERDAATALRTARSPTTAIP